MTFERYCACSHLVYLERTKPEFIIQIPKSSGVIFPVAEELCLATLASKENLKIKKRQIPDESIISVRAVLRLFASDCNGYSAKVRVEHVPLQHFSQTLQADHIGLSVWWRLTIHPPPSVAMSQ